MAARNGTAQITLNVFKAAKILLNAGSSQREVAEYLNISQASVNKINRAETFDEYKQIVNAWWCAKKKAAEEKAKKEKQEKAPETQEKPVEPQVVEHRQTVTIQATHYMMEEMKKQTELLTLINNKLGAIIDDLYGVKKEG